MRQIYVILPSQGMDSLSLSASDEDCRELLSAWTCAYHPEILRQTRKINSPIYGLYVYDEPENAILLTPKPTQEILDWSWIERAENRNCVFVKNCSDLTTLTNEVLEILKHDAELDAEKAAEEAARKAAEEAAAKEASEKVAEKAEAESEAKPEPEPAGDETPAEWETPQKNVNIAAALPSGDPSAPKVQDEMPETADFLALGLMHLLSEVMSHKLQFMSYLDSYSFSSDILSALDAMDCGDAAKAHREMQNAWDQLIQSRQYYAPQDGYVFDLALLDRDYIPETFQAELEAGTPLNVLADGAVIRLLAEKYPAMLETLKKRLEAKTLSLAGGEETETELPLLTQEGILCRLLNGLAVYEKFLGRKPDFYGRRKFGLTPLLPNILKRLGFDGALHFTLDDGKFPTCEQSRIGWKGMDGQIVESLAKVPVDAAKADSVAGAPEALVGSINTDNSFGSLFTHWAGEGMTSEWFTLLKRACKWTQLLGTLSTFSGCMDATRYSSCEEKFSPEKYVSPYLSQMVAGKEADPISRWARYHQIRAKLESLVSLESLANCLAPKDAPLEVGKKLLERLEAQPVTTKDFYSAARQETLAAERKAAEKISSVLSDGTRKNALLLLNPMSFSAIRTTDLTEAEKNLSVPRLVPEEKDAVQRHFWETHAMDSRQPVHAARVEVPPLGFAFLTDSPAQPAAPEQQKATRNWLGLKKKVAPLPSPVSQDPETGMWVIHNELLTLRFDPYTGHLRSVFDLTHRGNRFSQQLAMRLKSSPIDSLAEENPEDYTIMAADSFKPHVYADRSSLAVTGRLMDRKGEICARFTQTTTLRRGSSIVEFEVFLEPLKEPGRNPWQSYYASRLAWGDSAVDLFRNVGFSTQPTSAFRVEAPYFVDVRPLHYAASTRIMSSVTHEIAQRVRGRELNREDFFPERGVETEYSDARLTLLANGHPWHRNCGNRRLDTLLMVQGETSRRFRFAVAVNTPYPMKTALGFMAPVVQTTAALKSPETAALSGWFGHVSRKNVVITHWESTENGVLIRCAETEGRNVRVTFRALHPIKTAEQTDFRGGCVNTYAIDGDQVSFEMFGNEFKEIRLSF